MVCTQPGDQLQREISQGSILEPAYFNTIYYMEEEMEHMFIGFLEDTKLGCTGDLCEDNTQGCWQTTILEKNLEKAAMVLWG